MINPRIVTELQGNCPVDEFKALEGKIFYREIYQEFGIAVWVPRASIMEYQDPSIMALPIFQSLVEAFTKYPDFDSITLSNI